MSVAASETAAVTSTIIMLSCSGQLQSGLPALSPKDRSMAKGEQAGTKTGTWVQG